ncbi:MAG: glycosyltransferase family 4 protein [Patescibacteria group bacterium]
MKKILIITLSLSEKNGLGRYSRSIIERLSKNFKLIIFSGKEDDGIKRLPNCQIFRELPRPFNFYKLRHPLLFLSCLWKILKISKKVDFVHSFMDYPHSFLAALVAMLLRKPLFLTANGTYSLEPFRMWPDRYFHKFALKQAKKIICISKFTQGEIEKRINLSNLVLINDGIDFKKFFNPLIKKKIKNYSMIMGVGILKARKGYHISIPAIAEVKKKYSNIKYYIIGSQANKTYFDLLKSLIKNHSLEDNVFFLEEINDKELINFYYLANLFLLTPVNIKDNFEGFGLVYLEANACGKPVIGTYGCGAEDAIIDGVTGLLVPQNNIQKTSEAILKLLDNPELSKKMGENGKERAKKMDWDGVIKKYIDIYKLV